MDTNLSQPCDWCARKGVPGDGDGQFRDVDVDFNKFYYPGIPICGGCGGLGIQFDTEDFKARVERILKLRFEFHPTDGLSEPPTSVIYVKLKALIKEVEELTQEYGLGSENSYARRFIAPDSSFREALATLEGYVEENIRIIKETKSDEDPNPVDATREAMLKLYSGEAEEGLAMFKAALEKFPNDNSLTHDYGSLVAMYGRDLPLAAEYLEKATKLEPKKALHFYQAGKILVQLGKYPQAIGYLHDTKLQPDYEEFKANFEDADVDFAISRATLLMNL